MKNNKNEIFVDELDLLNVISSRGTFLQRLFSSHANLRFGYLGAVYWSVSSGWTTWTCLYEGIS
jgi:hypothetical protein